MSMKHEIYYIRETGFSINSKEEMCGNCNSLRWESIGIIMHGNGEWLYRKNPKCSRHCNPVDLTGRCKDYHYIIGVTEELVERS